MSSQYIYTMNRVSKVVPPKRQIIKDISLSFFPGAKIGLLGLNGAGKSTVLKIMAGVDTDFEGEARPQPGIKVGYLAQEPELDPTKTVREAVEEGVGEVLQAQAALDAVYLAYAEEGADFDALAKEQERLEAILAAGDAHTLENQLDVAADARPAHQLIIDLVRAHPGEVTLVAVGRMTNLALALQQAPDIAGLVRGVVIMGGAFHVNGNITPAAEANIWGDAEAADVVFTASWPVTAIGLDVTTRVEMDRDGLDKLAAIGGADAELVRALSQDYVDFYLQAGHKGMVVHDCCACIALTRPELFQFERASVRVATDGVARGMTIPKPEGLAFGPSAWDGHVVQSIAIGVDAAAVLADIEQTLKV